MTSGAAVLRLTAGVVLIAVIGLSPIPLASNRDWAWSPLAVTIGASLVAYGLSNALGAQRKLPIAPSLAVSMAAMTVVVAWGLLQAAPWFGPTRLASFLTSAYATLGLEVPNRDALDAERALTGVMRLAAYAGVFWLASQFGQDRRYAKAICLALVGSAVLITLYGWAMEVSVRSCIVVTVVKVQLAHGDPCPFSGTFVNSSNYADFASLACLVCLANLHDLFLQIGSSAHGARARWRARLMVLTGPGGLLLAALIFLFGSVVYSASRAGVASFVVAALGMTIMTAALNRERRVGLIGTAVGVGLLVALAVSLGGQGLLLRSLALLTDQESERSQLFAMTADAIAVYPWTGWGLGSFESLYSVFQPSSLFRVQDKAHNTYLENALDLGIPVSLLLIVAIAAPAWRCVAGLRERRRDTQFAAAAVGATILIAVHSTVDFGIQIPAVAVAYSSLLGVGWAQSWSSRHVANSSDDGS